MSINGVHQELPSGAINVQPRQRRAYEERYEYEEHDKQRDRKHNRRAKQHKFH